MTKLNKLVSTAKEALALAIRTINDGTNPRASGFDHLNRAEISACQVSHVQKALAALDQISFEPTPDPTSDLDDLLIQSVVATNKALAHLLSKAPNDNLTQELCLEHDLRVQKLLAKNPYALKLVKPAGSAIDSLFPAPTPYLGFAPCKGCHSRVMLVAPMHYIECSHCGSCADTPGEWNKLNCSPNHPTPLTEVPE